MIRRLLTIVLFLLLGAVVNVAVAWGCASRPGEYSTLHNIERVWPRGVPPGWSAPIWGQQYIGFGWTLDTFLSAPPDTPQASHVFLFRAGWPALALEALDRSYVADSAYSGGTWYFGLETGEYPAFPLRPIWPGFAINTGFYAATLWLLIPGPFVLRRFLRVRRGLCPKCGYPMGESSVCTECGQGLQHPVKATT